MRKALQLLRIVCVGLLLVSSFSLEAQVTNPNADLSINSFNNAFLTTLNGRTYYKRALNDSNDDGTWTLALDIFGLQDAYERTGSAAHKAKINELCNSFTVINPIPYNWDGWNDDLAWMGLAMARGYQITGTPYQLTAAKHCFNLAYNRGWNTTFNGGGIWEQQPDMTPPDAGVNKEALSNNPNGNLACLIYLSTDSIQYLNKALQIYYWSRSHLFNPNTGQVYAGIERSDEVNKSTAVYNQGSFIDFAATLYKITGNEMMLRDAQMAADYVIKNMTKNGVISNDAGYLNTWADTYARGLGHLCMWNPQLWDTYYPFMKKNTESILANRRTDLNLTWNAWDKLTSNDPAGKPTVYVSAVSLMQFTPTVQSIPAKMEAENYNFMSGIGTENCSEGGLAVGFIEAGDWMEYIVNVPTTGNYYITYRVAGMGTGSVAFQHNGKTLTTTNLPNTGNYTTFANATTQVYLTAGIQSVKLLSKGGGWNINNWTATACEAIKPFFNVNNIAWEQAANATLAVGNSLIFGPQPNDGAWSWTGPNNFTSYTREVTVANIQLNQGGDYIATYTSPLGCVSIQKFMVSLSGCTPTGLTPYIKINKIGVLKQTATTAAIAGDTILLTFASQPSEGTWSWSGPNGFAATTKEITFNGILNKQAGNYTSTYYNALGCKSTQVFTISVSGDDGCGLAITPGVNVNNQSWERTLYASVNNGGTVALGPQASDNGTWQWTGPSGFTSANREIRVNGFNASKAGHYIARYTHTSGCISSIDFVIGLTGCTTSSIVPSFKINGVTWSNTNLVTIKSGDSISITPPALNGSWSWTGPHGFTSSSRQITFGKILSWKDGSYKLTYADASACISTYTFAIDVTGDEYCSTPIVSRIAVNNGAFQKVSAATVNIGGSIKFAPEPANGEWRWTGPNGFVFTERLPAINNIQTTQAGVYKVNYTNNLGCYSYKDIIINVGDNPPIGNGDGLTGNYFNGTNFETPAYSRKDATVNFDWANVSPNAAVNSDLFSTRWSGQVQPKYSGEYTFTVNSDNGRRLWVNNQLVIDKWIDDWDIDYSGKITLTAGQKYDIKLEYFENNGGAGCKLQWSSVFQFQEVIPTSQLYSNPLPTVSIASPANNATFNTASNIVFTSNATDNGTVAKVEYYNGSVKIGESTTNPYSFSWNNVVAGNYSIFARATDNLGGIIMSPPIAVKVNAIVEVNQLPIVSLTAPVNNAAYNAPASITISANATDTDGAITKVEFYNGTALLNSDNTSPYSYSWTGVGAGNYTISAKAYDSGNATTSSENVTVKVNTVVVVNQSPTVSLTSPTASSSFNAPASITISANASDSDGTISKVEFYNGTTLLISDNTAPYDYTWTNVGVGNYNITAKAYDNSNVSATSASTSATVKTLATDVCSSLSSYVENGNYVAGSKVKNTGKQFECKEWPYSGWCNGAAWAYAPGVGAYWSDAWYEKGSCTARSSSTDLSTSSDVLDLLLIPNPVVNTLTLQSQYDLTGGKIRILSSLGIEVLTVDSYNASIDVYSLPSGLYTIIWSRGDNSVTKHFVK